MFGLGINELIVIFAILMLIFGGKKLPELSRSIGESIKELRKSMVDDPTPSKKAKRKA